MPRAFYDRDPRNVSRDLLGKVLVRRLGRKLRTARIVEIEAYLGEGDPAAHAAVEAVHGLALVPRGVADTGEHVGDAVVQFASGRL